MRAHNLSFRMWVLVGGICCQDCRIKKKIGVLLLQRAEMAIKHWKPSNKHYILFCFYNLYGVRNQPRMWFQIVVLQEGSYSYKWRTAHTRNLICFSTLHYCGSLRGCVLAHIFFLLSIFLIIQSIPLVYIKRKGLERWMRTKGGFNS